MEDCVKLDAFSTRLRQKLGDQRYASWIDGAIQANMQGDLLNLLSGSAFVRDYVRRNFASDILATAHETWGPQVKVAYVLHEVVKNAGPALPPSAQAESDQVLSEPDGVTREATHTTFPQPPAKNPAQVRLAPPHRDPFQDWVSGAPTVAVERVCRRVMLGEYASTPVLLWGAAGTGKTHLLRTLATATREARNKQRVLPLTAEQFLISFVDAVRGGGLPNFRHKHRGVDLLLLDNVHELAGKERTVEEFLHTVDSLLDAGGRVVVTSDRSPNDLRGLGPELSSRLVGGVVAEVETPDVPMRARLIQHQAGSLGLSLPNGVVQRLASRLVGGSREVTGALHRLELEADARGLEVNLGLADRVADDVNRIATPPVRLDDIQQAVCDVFGLEASLLKSSKRTKTVAEPRMLAMWLARKLTRSAWSEIGDYFGRRSHSTVISAHRRVERLLSSPEPTRLSGVGGDLHDAIRRIEAVLKTA